MKPALGTVKAVGGRLVSSVNVVVTNDAGAVLTIHRTDNRAAPG